MRSISPQQNKISLHIKTLDIKTVQLGLLRMRPSLKEATLRVDNETQSQQGGRAGWGGRGSAGCTADVIMYQQVPLKKIIPSRSYRNKA